MQSRYTHICITMQVHVHIQLYKIRIPYMYICRKAVKAAIVLLPLLGVNNFLVMVEPPVSSAVKFAIYSYTSQFLASFQGFFIALLYCFLNTEVCLLLFFLSVTPDAVLLQEKIFKQMQKTTEISVRYYPINRSLYFE